MERGAQVVLVEGDSEGESTLPRALAAAGFDVVVAADGQDALRAMAEVRPDLLIADVGAPAGDGWFILTALAAHADAPPVILIAPSSHPLEVARAYALGACDFVVRPSEPALVSRARRAATEFAVVA